MTQFNLIKYQESLLLKDDINLLQLRILIYLSHWMGKNDHVWPTNDMILESMPTSSLDSIKKRLKELEHKGYIERQTNNRKRRIYILDPTTKERFEPKGTPQVPQKIEGDSPGPLKGTPGVPPLPIYKKDNRKTEVPLSLKSQIKALRFKVPSDKRYQTGCDDLLKEAIDSQGFEGVSNILAEMWSESHPDYFEVLRERITP